MSNLTKSLLKDYPEVLAKALCYQKKQGKKQSFDTVLCETRTESINWNKTSEGVMFWSNIINKYNIKKIIPKYNIGDTIKCNYKNTQKEFIFIKWDLEHFAFWVMSKRAWAMLNEREPGENNRQGIFKLPVSCINWNE